LKLIKAICIAVAIFLIARAGIGHLSPQLLRQIDAKFAELAKNLIPKFELPSWIPQPVTGGEGEINGISVSDIRKLKIKRVYAFTVNIDRRFYQFGDTLGISTIEEYNIPIHVFLDLDFSEAKLDTAKLKITGIKYFFSVEPKPPKTSKSISNGDYFSNVAAKLPVMEIAASVLHCHDTYISALNHANSSNIWGESGETLSFPIATLSPMKVKEFYYFPFRFEKRDGWDQLITPSQLPIFAEILGVDDKDKSKVLNPDIKNVTCNVGINP
jgi:hypothetical protein